MSQEHVKNKEILLWVFKTTIVSPFPFLHSLAIKSKLSVDILLWVTDEIKLGMASGLWTLQIWADWQRSVDLASLCSFVLQDCFHSFRLRITFCLKFKPRWKVVFIYWWFKWGEELKKGPQRPIDKKKRKCRTV